MVVSMSTDERPPDFDSDRQKFLRWLFPHLSAEAAEKKLEATFRKQADKERWKRIEAGLDRDLYGDLLAVLYELRDPLRFPADA
jgi:hypothetical protein